MQDEKTTVLTDISAYYASKLAQHGDTPRGVDWNGESSQLVRFDQLSKILTSTSAFSLTDLGCGYGAFYDYLKNQYPAFSYSGIDISSEMIDAAKSRYGQYDNAIFSCADNITSMTDYIIASGVFNVRLNCPDAKWQAHLLNTLDMLDENSRLGFAFNCLTSYSDAERMQAYLYYADPCQMFDICKRRYSLNVALLHDYGLYEFTILVRK